MNDLQKYLVLGYSIFSFGSFLKGYYECYKKSNPIGTHWILNLIGAFVWADAVIFGLFWTLASLLSLYLNDWILFLLFQSVFWLIRSIGETIYWFLQQFSPINRNPIEKFWETKIFKDDSVWFVFQIFWQCVTVITIITTVYLVNLWLKIL